MTCISLFVLSLNKNNDIYHVLKIDYNPILGKTQWNIAKKRALYFRHTALLQVLRQLLP